MECTILVAGGVLNRNISKGNKVFINPRSEIKLIRKTKKSWMEFYELYRRIDIVDAWSVKDIDIIMDS